MCCHCVVTRNGCVRAVHAAEIEPLEFAEIPRQFQPRERGRVCRYPAAKENETLGLAEALTLGDDTVTARLRT